MEKPKHRIVLTIKKMYELAEKHYVVFENDSVSILLRLSDEIGVLEVRDVSMERLPNIQTPPNNMVN